MVARFDFAAYRPLPKPLDARGQARSDNPEVRDTITWEIENKQDYDELERFGQMIDWSLARGGASRGRVRKRSESAAGIFAVRRAP